MAKQKSRQDDASRMEEGGRMERSSRQDDPRQRGGGGGGGGRGGRGSSVARVTEITATSTQSFENAIDIGIERATKTLRNVRSAWIKEQQVRVSQGTISEYQVNMLVTFVLED
jgi:flavin-binding protein dodecin